MPLKLITNDSILEWFPIYFDSESQNPWPTNGDNCPVQKDSHTLVELDENFHPLDKTLGIEVAFFGLRRLTTGDMTGITNRVYQMNRKGESSFQYGTAAIEKILAACKKIKNVGDNADLEKEIAFNRSILVSLPQWVNDKLTEKINLMNNLTEVEELD